MRRDAISCLGTWAEELTAKASRVRKLIGSAHWLSDGHHKESIVREFLRRHLPPSLRINRGFLCPADPNARVSTEIDVLVTDSEAELPWFAEGELIIAPPSSARAHLHIKTELRTAELNDVFAAVRAVAESCESERDITELWGGAVFFEHTDMQTGAEMASLLWRMLDTQIAPLIGKHGAYVLPDCIAILGGPVVLIDKAKLAAGEKGEDAVRVFDCSGLSIAILLSHLYDSISSSVRRVNRRGEWVKLLQTEEFTLHARPA